MKKFLLSIVLALMFSVPFMVTADPDYAAPIYQVDVTSSAADVTMVDTVFTMRRTSPYQIANVDRKLERPGSTQNCGSCHSAVQKTAAVGVSGGDSIGISKSRI